METVRYVGGIVTIVIVVVVAVSIVVGLLFTVGRRIRDGDGL